MSIKPFAYVGFLVAIATLLESCYPKTATRAESDESEKAVLLALNKQQSFWNDGNMDGFMSLYKNTSELSFASHRGIDFGYDTIFQRYKKTYKNREDMGRLEFKVLQYLPTGENHAAVIGKWTLFRSNDQPGGYFSLLWENTEQGWKIIHDHTS